jgi:hypothetical protein
MVKYSNSFMAYDDMKAMTIVHGFSKLFLQFLTVCIPIILGYFTMK